MTRLFGKATTSGVGKLTEVLTDMKKTDFESQGNAVTFQCKCLFYDVPVGSCM